MGCGLWAVVQGPAPQCWPLTLSSECMNGQRSQVVGGLAETLSWRPTLFESSSGEAQGWLDFSALTARTS